MRGRLPHLSGVTIALWIALPAQAADAGRPTLTLRVVASCDRKPCAPDGPPFMRVAREMLSAAGFELVQARAEIMTITAEVVSTSAPYGAGRTCWTGADVDGAVALGSDRRWPFSSREAPSKYSVGCPDTGPYHSAFWREDGFVWQLAKVIAEIRPSGISSLVSAGDARVKSAALAALEALPRAEAIALLEPVLRSADPPEAGFTAFARLAGTGALGVLKEAANDPGRRSNAIKALGILAPASPEAVGVLVDLLAFPLVRAAATAELARTGGEQAKRGIVAALLRGDAGKGTNEALFQMGWIPSTDEERVFRHLIDRYCSLPPELADVARPHLVALVRADRELSWCAAQALGTLKDREAVDDLIAALGSTRAEVRESAACALLRMQEKRALEPLRALQERVGKSEISGAMAARAIRGIERDEVEPGCTHGF